MLCEFAFENIPRSQFTFDPSPGCSITALFLATKSENERISIEQFCADMRKTREAVLSLEFVISQGLKFEYYVHHPFRACHGLFLDIDVCAMFSIFIFFTTCTLLITF